MSENETIPKVTQAVGNQVPSRAVYMLIIRVIRPLKQFDIPGLAYILVF